MILLDLDLLNAVAHRRGFHAHKRIWLYTKSPLLALLLLGMTYTAPPNHTVLQRATWPHTHKFKSKLIITDIVRTGEAIFHLHVQGLWARPHSPVPKPGSCPCHPSKQRVYQSYLWKEGHFHHKLLIQIVGSAGVPFPSSQMTPVRNSTKKKRSERFQIFIFGPNVGFSFIHCKFFYRNFPLFFLQISRKMCDFFIFF